MEQNPAFMLAVKLCLHSAETLGEEHPETLRAMMVVMRHAPKALKDQFNQKAVEMGLIPKEPHYLEDGTPVYRLDEVAETLGMSEAEARDELERVGAEMQALGLMAHGGVFHSPASKVHRRQ